MNPIEQAMQQALQTATEELMEEMHAEAGELDIDATLKLYQGQQEKAQAQQALQTPWEILLNAPGGVYRACRDNEGDIVLETLGSHGAAKSVQVFLNAEITEKLLAFIAANPPVPHRK